MNKLQLSLILLLMIARSQAQSIQLKGGSSDLYGGSGGSVDIYLKKHQINLSGGIQSGALQFGLSDRFSFRGMTFVAGDSSFSYSVDGSGLGVAVRGISIKRGNLSIFSGMVGLQTFLPYYSTLRPQHFGTGFFWCKKHGRFEYRTLNVISGNQKTTLHSVKYLSKYFQGTASVGMYQNQFQITGFAALQLEHLTATANRIQQTFQGNKLTTNSLAASFHVTRFSVSSAIVQANYQGTTTTGLSASATLRMVDWMTVGSSYYKSSGQSVVQANVQANGRKLSTTAAVDTQKHYSGSLELHTHRFTISAGRTEVLIPKRGWVSSTVFSLSVKIHDIAISASRIFLPDGSKKLTVSGSDWVYRDKVQDQEPKFAKYLIEGLVVDENNAPVAGVPVKLGQIICFSDNAGQFYLRVKHQKKYSVEILTDDFMMAGKIKVITSEKEIAPGSNLRIVVQRI